MFFGSSHDGWLLPEFFKDFYFLRGVQLQMDVEVKKTRCRNVYKSGLFATL
jgi:hypothetical protein